MRIRDSASPVNTHPGPVESSQCNTERNRDMAQEQISTPVGTDEGRIVFAHVRFDSSIKKEFVSSLKQYLDYLETTLP